MPNEHELMESNRAAAMRGHQTRSRVSGRKRWLGVWGGCSRGALRLPLATVCRRYGGSVIGSKLDRSSGKFVDKPESRPRVNRACEPLWPDAARPLAIWSQTRTSPDGRFQRQQSPPSETQRVNIRTGKLLFERLQ